MQRSSIEIGLWKNNKTGKQYYVDGLVVNATNSKDGGLMVLYNCEEFHLGFVREITEFQEKFTKIS